MPANVSLTDSEKDLIADRYSELREKGLRAKDIEDCLAVELGVSTRTIRNHRVKAEPLTSGDFEASNATEAFVKGTSTLYDANGNVTLKWVKTDARGNNLKQFAETLTEAFKANVEPVTPRSAEKIRYSEDHLAVYPIGDHHTGLHSWKPESGATYDLKIAEQLLCDAIDRLVKTAPRCDEGLIISVGDFFHSDNRHAHTTNSTHTLDVDTRYQKVLEVGIRAFRRAIESALEHHRIVHVICALGNHDWHTSLFLSMALKHIYEREERVKVADSYSPRIYHRFGANLIGVTHGDKTKPDSLPLLMAAERQTDWGETKHRVWYTGHLHHERIKEYTGCKVETARTLAGRDSYHAEHGYLSGRDMQAVVHHREFGQVERYIVSVEMLEKARQTE